MTPIGPSSLALLPLVARCLVLFLSLVCRPPSEISRSEAADCRVLGAQWANDSSLGGSERIIMQIDPSERFVALASKQIVDK